MHRFLARAALISVIGSITVAGTAGKAAAQTYPIDCAILLCLSGGWPASVPCTRARAEFIRRITPWPVEPPLQIWRCPMGASFVPSHDQKRRPDINDISFEDKEQLFQTFPEASHQDLETPTRALLRPMNPGRPFLPDGFTLHLTQNRADIDISGPEFNFVRSIRVYDVRYARQREAGRDGDCSRSATIVLGTYGTQGDFAWQQSSPAALPEAHLGLERWGEDCPNVFHRSVFVDWRDYEGNYGSEQVNY